MNCRCGFVRFENRFSGDGREDSAHWGRGGTSSSNYCVAASFILMAGFVESGEKP